MKLLSFILITLALSALVKSDFLIDNFQTQSNISIGGSTTDILDLAPSRLYTGNQQPNLSAFVRRTFNNLTNATTIIYPNLYQARIFQPKPVVFGGYRRIVIASITESENFAPQTGASVYVSAGSLFTAVGSDLQALIAIQWVGTFTPDLSNCTFPNAIQCAQQLNVGPLLPQSYDITQGGVNQALAVTIANDLAGNFIWTVYSSPTTFSQRVTRTSPTKRDPSDPDYDADLIVYDVPFAQPMMTRGGKRVTVGRRYVVPFQSFARPVTAAGPADFTRVTGITLQILPVTGLDSIVSDARAVPLVAQTKQDNIVETVSADGIAEPGEIINYTVTVSVASGLEAGTSVNNIYVYDNPNKYFGYGTYLPNTFNLTSYQYNQVNCSVNNTATCADSFTVDPFNFGARIYNASDDAIFANKIAIFFPTISSGSYATIQYSVQIPNLECALVPCSSGCSFANQTSITAGCYCQQNQGRVCLGVQQQNLVNITRNIDANNDSNANVGTCAPTTDVRSGTFVTTTPVGTRPNPALTIAANPTQKANGVNPGGNLTYTVTVSNNSTRSSDSFNISFTPDSNAICQVGAGSPNPTFTSDATTGNPVYSVSGGLQYGQTISISITCQANPNAACGTNLTTMAATLVFPTTQICQQTTTADDSGSDFIPLVGVASITLTKANATTLNYGAGSNSSNVASFAINYSNNGARTANGVVITETIPSNLAQFYQATDNPSFVAAGGNNYTLTIASLAPGQSGSVNFLLRAPSTLSDCVTGSYINTVSSNAVCGAAAITAQAFVSVNAVPDLAVTITNGPATVQPGQQVCYTVSYQNVGYRVGESVVLSIVLPSFTTYSASGSSNWQQSGTSNVYTLAVGNVQAQSAAATATFCVVAASNTVCGSAFSTNVNVTAVCAGFPEQNFANNFAATTVTSIAGSVTLTLSKVPTQNGVTVSSVNTGSTIVYSISGSNTGSSQAQNVTIVETLPSGTTAGANSGFVLGSAGSYSYFVGAVNAGASFGPFNFSVVVPSSVDCPAPNITNTATVTESCVGATASASATVNINAAPFLTLQAQNTTTVFLSQGTQTCVYACYGNTGNQTANSAVLTLAYGSTYLTPVSGSNNGWTQSGSSLTYTVGNINVGANVCSPAACFNVQSPIPCGVNNVSFTFTLASICAATSPVSTTITNIVAEPVFTITKSNNVVGEATPGQAVTYTITYQNTGLRIADNTVLTESIPQFFSPGANSGWTSNGASYTYNVGSLSPSQGQQTVTFSGTLTAGTTGRTVVNNTVTIASQPCVAAASASSLLTVAGFPNLVITKTDTGVTITPGDYIYYTITYSNNGDAPAPNVTITDIVPAFTKFNVTGSTAGWNCTERSGAGTVCSVNVGTVNPGQTGTLTFIVKSVDWIRCGTDFTQNFAFIATPVQETSYADNNATVITPIMGTPSLVIQKTANRTRSRADRAGPGELIVFNITYANIGVRDATDMVIYETVPEYTTYVAAASSAWNCPDGAAAGTVCTFAYNSSFYPAMPGMGDMMGYGQLTFTVRVINDLPPTAHITTNCAMINNTCGECNPFDNMACYSVNLFGVPDLVLNQSATCRSFKWYIEWQNVGDQAATNVTVVDTVPTGTNFDAAASDSRWVCNNDSTSANFRQCTLFVGEVPSGAGGSASFITAPQAGTTLDMFSNTASVSGTGRNPDPTPQNNQDTATIGFNGCPDTCDSCCPVANECCPDKTEVLFNFRGILQGIDSCAASGSSS